MIRTFDLARRYGSYLAVDGVDLRVEAGETFGFLGLNGAGKTTVMRMICGLLRPNRGHAQVGDVLVRGPQDTWRLVPTLSFVSQEMKFHEHATLRELLAIYATLAGAPPERGLQFARRAAVPLDRLCCRLSPGQQRKAQLAIALLKEPRYLLLDEPTAGLDPRGVAEMRDILADLHGTGATIFFSSHILGEVQAQCTSVGILHQGKLRCQQRIAETYRIAVGGDPLEAAGILAAAGVRAACDGDGLRVAVPQADLPAVVQRLVRHGVQTGLVQAVSLEDIFNQVVGAGEAAA